MNFTLGVMEKSLKSFEQQDDTDCVYCFLKMTLAVMLRADFRKAEEEENLSSYCNNLGEE